MPADMQTEQTEEVVVHAAPEADPEAVEQEEESAAIEIDGQSFKTEAEALEYARTKITAADIELARADAYRQAAQDLGQRVTHQPNVTPQPQEDEKEWEQKFFENPKKALEDAMAKARAEALSEVGKMTALDRENARLWSRFCELNPDLADFKEDVEHATALHREAAVALKGTKGEDAALNYIATKTRSKFQQWAEKAKPGTPMSKGGGASPSGGGKDVTSGGSKKSDDKPLSFVEQIKQNKKRHA